MNPYYRAYCKRCGWTVKTGAESTFMDPFFLPERCPGCHEYHSRHAWSYFSDECLYTVEYGFMAFVPAAEQPPKVWFLPWTWAPVGERVWTLWSTRPADTKGGE
jgi:hypothetical protein